MDQTQVDVSDYHKVKTGMRHVLAIDQGTTGSTVLLIDETTNIVGRGYAEFPQIYPKPGWVEHDPAEIWKSVTTAIGKALQTSSVSPTSIAAVGITNQRETSLLWDRETGAPIGNAIVWQDRRTAEFCQALKSQGHEPEVSRKTGLVLDPYFSATKLRWMLEQDAGTRSAAESGKLCFGTIDSYLVHKLSGGAAHVTEVSNASRTLLFDIHAMSWSPSLLELFQVPEKVLPAVKTSSEIYAETRGVSQIPDGIPISGMAGDQQSALFGQACFEPGSAKCTYGTGSFILMNTGTAPVASKSKLLTTVAWKLGNEADTYYALEGSSFIAGAAVQWLRDGLGLIDKAEDVEALASSVPNSEGVVMVPAFAGLGAPHWRPEARGLISGITRGTTKAHLARAALEGIALQQKDIVAAMAKDSGNKLTSFRVDGGACANNLLMQMQADVLNTPLSRPKVIETTALGAAFLAGLGAGVWKTKQTLTEVWQEDKRFTPTKERGPVDELLKRWDSAVAAA